MNTEPLVVVFDDEADLQGVLADREIGAQSKAEDLRRTLKSGATVVVDVLGMPRRLVMLDPVTEKLAVSPIG